MTGLFRDTSMRAFMIGFIVAGIPMALSAGLFS
jgi:hypothetical protein